jgi:hypothetical protein
MNERTFNCDLTCDKGMYIIYLWSVCYFRLLTFDLKVLPIIVGGKAKAAVPSCENISYIFL